MNIIKVASLLIITLLIVPVISYFFGTPLDETHLLALKTVIYINLGLIIYCFVVGEITNNNSSPITLTFYDPTGILNCRNSNCKANSKFNSK